MKLNNSIIFPSSIINIEYRPVKEYLNSIKSTEVEDDLMKHVFIYIDYLTCDTLIGETLKKNEILFDYSPYDNNTGEPLLGFDGEGHAKFTTIEIVKRMQSQHDGTDVFEGRIQLDEDGLPYLSKRLFFGTPSQASDKKVYTHYQDKNSSATNTESSNISTQMAGECNFLLSNVNYKSEPYKTYIREGIELW